MAKYAGLGEDVLFFGIGTLLVAGVVGGTVYGVNRTIKKHREDNANDRIFGQKGSSFPASQSAVKLKVAFDNCGSTKWWTGTCFGTDEEAVFAALEEIPTIRDWNNVEKEYEKITMGRNLNYDLKEELEDGEGDFLKAVEIINNKPAK